MHHFRHTPRVLISQTKPQQTQNSAFLHSDILFEFRLQSNPQIRFSLSLAAKSPIW
ncbi:hypothetical protein SLEP1_g49793 [Rubroshorea leprosula]|uniref:Uncharacterized protein n=1 Tax=Rubroshorea leprosula TaxID=152421 RepID=A0AAV5M101_9ROSI|nr:hypothetical protein SLEP1_g49793 [Rubroshorea leprosula]